MKFLKPFFSDRRWVWGAAGILSLGVVMTGGAVRDYVIRVREHSRLTKKLHAAKVRLEDKRSRLTRAQSDDSFLELEARRHLGLVRADEIEFRFVSAEGQESMRRTGPVER